MLKKSASRGRNGQVPFLLAERAQSECARSMRAVKASLATPSQEEIGVGAHCGSSHSAKALIELMRAAAKIVLGQELFRYW